MLPTSLLLLTFAWPAIANTEIVNFYGGSHYDLSIEERDNLGWPRLPHPLRGDQLLSMTPAPVPEGTSWEIAFPQDDEQNLLYELWVTLDLDSFPTSALWESHMYALRLSWPAWSPVDFQLMIHDPSEMVPYQPRFSVDSSGPMTHTHYARIRAKNGGLHRNESYQQEDLQFHLALEKLHFGFLPPSVVPTLLVMIASLAPSYFAAQYILRRLSPITERSNHELRSTTESNKDD